MGKKAKNRKIKAKEQKSSAARFSTEKSSVLLQFVNSAVFHLLLVVLVGSFCYSNTFDSPFQWDEEYFITTNPFVKNVSNYSDPELINNNPILADHFKNRLVGYLTFAANYRLNRFDVTGYHIVNFSIHILNAFLVYFLLLLTFRTPFLDKTAIKKQSEYIAFFSALLFVSHPVQTEAVTYIYQRLASLVTLFYLSAIVMYIKARLVDQAKVKNEAEVKAEKIRRYSIPSYVYIILSIIFTVLAMKTKENAFTIPFVIALYELSFFEGSFKLRALRLAPFMLTLLIIPLTIIGIHKPLEEIVTDIGPAAMNARGIGRWEYLFTELRVIVTYIRLLFLPINQNLDYYYAVSKSFFEPKVLLSFIFLTAVSGYAVFLYWRSRFSERGLRVIAVGIFWFFITLSVESGLIPIQMLIDEYRIYLSSAGFFMAVVTAGFLLSGKNKSRKFRIAFISFLVVIVLSLSYATYARNMLWKSRLSMWGDVVKKSPWNPRAHNNLGNAYKDEGMIKKAAEQYLLALKLNPESGDANNNLADVYMSMGLYDKAFEHAVRAVELKPNTAVTHNNLGNAYMNKGMIDMAEEEYRIALKLRPDYAEANSNLGVVYFSKKMYDKAIEQYRTAIRMDPNYADAYSNMGNIYFMKEENDKAIGYYLSALRIKPDFPDANNNLGSAYMAKGLYEEAYKHYLDAIRLRPNYANAHSNLGMLYLKQGLFDKAYKEFEITLRIDPSNQKARRSIDYLSKKIQR